MCTSHINLVDFYLVLLQVNAAQLCTTGIDQHFG